MAPDGTELEPGFVLRRTEWGPRIHGPTGMELQVGYSGAVSTLQDVELPPAPWGAKRSLRYRRTPNELRIDVEPRGSGDAGEFPELVADLAAADTEIRAVHHRHTAETAFCKHPNATYSEPENTGRAHGHAVYEWALNCPDCGVVETHGADSSG